MNKGVTPSLPLNLASTQQLVDEICARFPHCIIAFRTILVEGQNEAMEGHYHGGDYRTRRETEEREIEDE